MAQCLKTRGFFYISVAYLFLIVPATIIIFFPVEECFVKTKASRVYPVVNLQKQTSLSGYSSTILSSKLDSQSHYLQLQNDLEGIRAKLLTKLNASTWKKALSNATLITGKNVNFIYRLRYQHGIYFILKYFFENNNNQFRHFLPIGDHYYRPFANQPACDYYMGSYYKYPQWYNQWNLQLSCNTSEFRQHVSPTSLKYILNSGKRSHNQWFTSNSSELLTYITVIDNAYINAIGSITNGMVTIHPINCFEKESNATFVVREAIATIDEVFIISQNWGDGYFYMNAKNLPRLALYVEFLKEHPQIFIHMAPGPARLGRWVRHADESLRALGIDPKRIVRGDMRAKIVYLPRSSQCVHILLLPEIQTLAARYHNFIQNNLYETEHSSILLIVRESWSGIRNIARDTYKQIIATLNKLIVNTSLKLELFDDRDSPTFYDTVRMFYRAKIVVGIHGAGLVNMIYSRPGTQIIEMICQPPVNINFALTAGILGHRYHAYPVLGCPRNVTININELAGVILMYVSLTSA